MDPIPPKPILPLFIPPHSEQMRRRSRELGQQPAPSTSPTSYRNSTRSVAPVEQVQVSPLPPGHGAGSSSFAAGQGRAAARPAAATPAKCLGLGCCQWLLAQTAQPARDKGLDKEFPMVDSMESLGGWPRLLAYRRAIHHAQKSTSMAVKLQFVALYNTYYSHRLRTEESALQFLGHNLAYLYLAVGVRVQMHIAQRIDPCWGHPAYREQANYAAGAPVCFVPEHSYASQYQIVARTDIDQHQGCLAMLLQPCGSEQAASQRWLIAFRGTANNQDALNRRVGDGQGYLADLDPKGIGHTAFEHHASTLFAWLELASKHGQKVTVVGHSLGGVMALRLAAAVCQQHSDLVSKLDIVTFNAPGLDSETLARLQAGLAIRMFRTTYDWINQAGEGHPQGMVYETRGHPLRRLYNHSRAYLAEAEIMEASLPVTVQLGGKSGISGWIEGFRCWLAGLRQSWLAHHKHHSEHVSARPARLAQRVLQTADVSNEPCCSTPQSAPAEQP